MKNKLSDLNNHLFAQLERLNEEGISDEALNREVMRARSIDSIAKNIINNANVQLQAMKMIDSGDIPSNAKRITGIEE